VCVLQRPIDGRAFLKILEREGQVAGAVIDKLCGRLQNCSALPGRDLPCALLGDTAGLIYPLEALGVILTGCPERGQSSTETEEGVLLVVVVRPVQRSLYILVLTCEAVDLWKRFWSFKRWLSLKGKVQKIVGLCLIRLLLFPREAQLLQHIFMDDIHHKEPLFLICSLPE